MFTRAVRFMQANGRSVSRATMQSRRIHGARWVSEIKTSWKSSDNISMRVFCGLVVASCVGLTKTMCEERRQLSVDEVIALYEQVDANMRILAQKMMEALAHEIDLEMEKDEMDRMSVEQRAIQMSDTFERVLGEVQDSVFRNHYVTKDQVVEAMRRIESGELKLSEQDAETIQEYIRKLGRLRWECTGSREPISRLGTQRAKPQTTPVPRHVVLNMSKELIPTLTKKMEEILAAFKRDGANLQDNVIRQRVAKLYLEASQEVTDAIATKYNVSVEDFHEALVFFHDDANFQATIAQLTEQQHKRFMELGL